MGESWWAEHGQMISVVLWGLIVGALTILWWFIRKNLEKTERDIDDLRSEVAVVKSESITRFEQMVAQIADLKLTFMAAISDLKVSRAQDFATKEDLREGLNDLREIIITEKKRK